MRKEQFLSAYFPAVTFEAHLVTGITPGLSFPFSHQAQTFSLGA
jgi:hypothetical protein